MLDIIGKETLLESFKAVFKEILNKVINGHKYNIDQKTKIAEALISINQAILETKNFIKTQGYRSNTEISKLWHEALLKSIAADLKEGLPEFLYHKADFWGSPNEWLENRASLEIVPKLDDLKKLCDEIMVRLN